MLNPIQGLGERSYGLLYIIQSSYLYIIASESFIDLPFLGSIDVIVAGSLLILSLYAALWLHHTSLLIFGNDAGMESSRKSSIIRKHLTFFATGVEPNKLPDTTSLAALITSAIRSDDMRWGVFLRFVPAGFFKIYLIAAWLWLTLLFIENNGAIISGGFWLILSVIIFRDRVVGYLPNYIPPDSAERIHEAEYVRTYRSVSEEGSETQKRPRIKKQGTMNSPRRF